MSTFVRPLEPPWMIALRLTEGVREVPGEASHPIILEMHAALGPGVESDEVAWCSGAIAWSFRQCGMRIPDGVTRAARSWLNSHKHLDTIPAAGKPPRGAIAVLWRVRPDSWQGHVGLVTGWLGNDHVTLLGGNQGNAVSVTRYPIERVLAFMWPRGFDPEAFQL